MGLPQSEKDFNTHYLLPGGLFAHTEPYIVSTVLGSCISVILIDSENGVTGINHYMLPLWNGEGLPSPKYGNIANVKLIEKMLSLGANKKRLKAKVIGGATLHGNPTGILDVGNRNINISFEFLANEGIPILNSDVGGNRGRKLMLNTSSGIVKIKMLGEVLKEIF